MEDLLNERKQLFTVLRYLYNEVNKIKEQININEEEIKNTCNHDPVIDTGFQAEHTQWVCKKCGFNI